MRREACASAGDVIALRERRASTAAVKGVDRLKRNEKGFICEGFRLLGGKMFWASRVHCSRGSPAARPGPASTAILGIESRLGRARRGDWMTASFFSMARRSSATLERRRASSETGHAIDSLLEWHSSPQNNRKWAA